MLEYTFLSTSHIRVFIFIRITNKITNIFLICTFVVSESLYFRGILSKQHSYSLFFLFSTKQDKGRIRRRSHLISIANRLSPQIKKIWSALVDSRMVAYWTINTWKRLTLSRIRYTKKIVRPRLYTYT